MGERAVRGSVHPPPGGGLTSLRIHLMGSREAGTCLASSAVQSRVSFLTYAFVLTIQDMANKIRPIEESITIIIEKKRKIFNSFNSIIIKLAKLVVHLLIFKR